MPYRTVKRRSGSGGGPSKAPSVNTVSACKETTVRGSGKARQIQTPRLTFRRLFRPVRDGLSIVRLSLPSNHSSVNGHDPDERLLADDDGKSDEEDGEALDRDRYYGGGRGAEADGCQVRQEGRL